MNSLTSKHEKCYFCHRHPFPCTFKSGERPETILDSGNKSDHVQLTSLLSDSHNPTPTSPTNPPLSPSCLVCESHILVRGSHEQGSNTARSPCKLWKREKMSKSNRCGTRGHARYFYFFAWRMTLSLLARSDTARGRRSIPRFPFSLKHLTR